MKKLIAVLSCVATVGAFTAMGMYAPASKPAASMEYQPKPVAMPPVPRVMQDAQCSPTPPDGTPGGHFKKPKRPSMTPNR